MRNPRETGPLMHCQSDRSHLRAISGLPTFEHLPDNGACHMCAVAAHAVVAVALGMFDVLHHLRTQSQSAKVQEQGLRDVIEQRGHHSGWGKRLQGFCEGRGSKRQRGQNFCIVVTQRTYVCNLMPFLPIICCRRMNAWHFVDLFATVVGRGRWVRYVLLYSSNCKA